MNASRSLALVRVITLLPILATSPAQALNRTPGLPLAIRVENAIGTLNNVVEGSAFDTLAVRNGYALATFTDFNNGSPTVTVTDVRDLMLDGVGLWGFFGHSAPNGFGAEWYPTVEEAVARRNQYIADGVFLPTEILIGNTPDQEFYCVLVDSTFIRKYYRGAEAIVMNIACDGLDYANSYLYQGRARVVVGKFEVCNTGENIVDLNNLVDCMDGQCDPYGANRPVGYAVNGTQLRYVGNGETVIAPTGVISCPSTLYAPQLLQVAFDCAMDTSVPPSAVLRPYGSIALINPRWTTSSTLEAILYGYYRGPGGVVVASISDFTEGARSTGYVYLDGNHVAPNGDPMLKSIWSEMVGDNPTASVVGFAVTPASVDSLQASWTIEQESESDHYLVEMGQSPDGPFGVVRSLPSVGPVSKQVLVPAAADSFFRLVEVQSDGDSVVQAHAQIEPVFTIAGLPALPDPEPVPPDSNLLSVGLPQSVEEWDYLVFTPHEWAGQAQTLAAQVAVSRNLTPLVIDMGPGMTPAEIKEAIAAVRPGFVVLFADASDSRSADGTELWQNDALWTRGFTRPAWPAQPQNNRIPMFYFQDPATQSQSLTRSTPWAGNDWWYIDFNNDSLPDPGMCIGRIPVHNSAEAAAYVTKDQYALALSAATSFMNHCALWEYSWDEGDRNGQMAHDLGDSLVRYLPLGMVVDSVVDRPHNVLNAGGRNTAARNALDQGRSLILLMGTAGQRYGLGEYCDVSQGFDPASLIANPTRLPFVLGTVCNAGDVDKTEDPALGRPVMERFILESQRGPWGGFGPSRGSWVYGDFLIGRDFLLQAYSTGAPSAAAAAAATALRVASRNPQFKPLVLSYVFVGDPAVTVPFMNTTPAVMAVGGAKGGQGPTIVLLSRNPVRGPVRVGYYLPRGGHVAMRLFDVQGRMVHELVRGEMPEGSHVVSWDGTGGRTGRIAAGVYFLMLEASGKRRTAKLVVLDN